jgi:2,4-dienoyl-CoA reductase-like NADH-dependent reductase (Old Yellow Enzyme family)
MQVSQIDGNDRTIVNGCTTGRQSPRLVGGRYPWVPPLAPSANPMAPSEGRLSRLVFSLLFQSPRAMSIRDIDSVVDAFLKSAKVACRAGFDGIQLHASHGCE